MSLLNTGQHMAAKSFETFRIIKATGEACADEVARVAVGKGVQAAVEECKT